MVLKILSKILFYFSSFSVLPPRRAVQDQIISEVEKCFVDKDIFVRNSLRQYQCHAHYFVPMIWVAFQFFSILALLPLVMVLLLRSFRKSRLNAIRDIVLFSKVPGDIQKKFNPVYVKKPLGYLRPRDYKFALKILLQGGLRPYFLLRSIWKIAVYSELIDTYQPQRIWVTQEMVFESSLLTQYLSYFSVRHVNFMHGVNYFSIQVAFSSFHDFYIWDEYYIQLFNSLKIQVEKYDLFLAIDRVTGHLPQKNVIKYYGQYTEKKEDFAQIIDHLIGFAKAHNCIPMARLHPLHKKQIEIDVLNERGVAIEPNSVDLIDSLGEASYVCSEFSAVLYQAYLLNRKIVIDNSFPDRIARLQELDMIFFDKLPHEFLV